MQTFNNDLELHTATAKKLANIAYLLQMAGLLIGVTFVIGVIFNYLKIKQVRGTWVESHFNWQIKTFWYGLAILILGVLTLANVLGGIILVFDALWVSYRVFYGWSALNKGEQVTKLP
jgi:uncharacterized membrane protein